MHKHAKQMCNCCVVDLHSVCVRGDETSAAVAVHSAGCCIDHQGACRSQGLLPASQDQTSQSEGDPSFTGNRIPQASPKPPKPTRTRPCCHLGPGPWPCAGRERGKQRHSLRHDQLYTNEYLPTEVWSAD